MKAPVCFIIRLYLKKCQFLKIFTKKSYKYQYFMYVLCFTLKFTYNNECLFWYRNLHGFLWDTIWATIHHWMCLEVEMIEYYECCQTNSTSGDFKTPIHIVCHVSVKTTHLKILIIPIKIIVKDVCFCLRRTQWPARLPNLMLLDFLPLSRILCEQMGS